MLQSMRQLFDVSMRKALVRTARIALANAMGVKWLATTIRKEQIVTTAVLVDPKDVTGLPSNDGERIAMKVTRRVKVDVHQDVRASVVRPVIDTIMFGLVETR